MKEIFLVLILMPVSILGTTAARMATSEVMLVSEWIHFNATTPESSIQLSYSKFKQLKTAPPGQNNGNLH